MEIVKFTETIFSSKGKIGKLTPDSDGYYSMILGALNVYNSVGEYYTAKDTLDLFESSSTLMRKIKNGALYGEVGHPVKETGMSHESYYNRIMRIADDNVCAHISEISLDFKYGEKFPEYKSPEMIAIIGKVKPAGPKANALQLALENNKQNAAFSVRGITKNKYKNGRVDRALTNIITWDHVTEPGISAACKANSPSLESYISTESFLNEISSVAIDKDILTKVLKNNIADISLESNRSMYADILKAISNNNAKNKLSNW